MAPFNICSELIVLLKHESLHKLCILFQAIIFWIVDNFLKQSIQNTKHVYIDSDDTSVKYFKSADRVRCYNRIEKAEDFESDMLLSTDEDGDPVSRHRTAADSADSLLAT